MTTLGPLLVKDLRRARRNPVPWLIHLALPLLITGLIGLAFGPRSSSGGGLGKIRLGLVDQDDSALTRFLRGALSQDQAGEHLAVEVLTREAALERINDDKLSAVWVIPKGFTEDYLAGEKTVEFELIKNPAQVYHPAIVEEGLGLLTTGLNALGRGFRAEMPSWRRLFEDREGAPDLVEWGRLVERVGRRLEAVRPYVDPPLLRYTREASGEGEPDGGSGGGGEVFPFLLAGLAAMFLLFLADNAVRDLYREQRFQTLARFHTLREGLLVLVVSKGVFAVVILGLGSLVMYGGGALLFGFGWRDPWVLVLLTLAYALCGTGLMSLVAALAGSERRADLFNTLLAMGLGLAGGCMFPPQQLPAILREGVMPWLPTHWYVSTVRALQFGEADLLWVGAVLKLAVLGVVAMVLAAGWYRRQLERGIR